MHVTKHRTLALFTVLALAACSGKDGVTGQTGPAGAPGAAGATGSKGEKGDKGEPGVAPLATTEGCQGCHGATLAEKHALTTGNAVDVKLQHWNASGAAVKVDHDNNASTATVQLPAVEVDPTTFVVTIRYHVTVNGVVNNDFTLKATDMGGGHNEDAWWYYDAAQKAGVREKIPCGKTASPSCTYPSDTGGAVTWSIVANGNGNYTAKVSGFTAPLPAGTAFMLNATPPNGPVATVVAYAGDRTHDLVSDAACINCHGKHIWRGAAHDVTNAQGVGPCTVCHNRVGATETRLSGYISKEGATALGVAERGATAGTQGTGLMGIVHGVHNSANMPDGTYTWVWTNQTSKTDFKKGFSGNMNNCASCHMSADQLTAAVSAPVSYALCISCHDSWDGFASTKAGALLDFHRNYDATVPPSSCAACHNGTSAPANVNGFHNGLITERAGVIWDGADQSVVLASKIKLAITGVTMVGTNLEVTWTAKDASDVAYDPCNSDFANGPVFFGYDPKTGTEGCTGTAVGCQSNMRFSRSYALANDWVNDGLKGSSAPGQPAGSTTPSSTNTTCDASKVAKTVMPAQTTTATKGIVALEGKPQWKFATSSTESIIIWVRAKTPTREFDASTGAAPAVARRTIVSIDKCIACHLGTVYQHGGGRVDSMELCVMCHNPAANEQNRRLDIGVTADKAYDGKAGESYDMRYMVHAIHAAGETKMPLMYYRGNGIFFFGAKEKLPANWPPIANPSSCVTCGNEDGVLTYCPVVGSKTSGDKFERNADGTCKNDVASTSGTWRPHRVIEVHYPRALNDCGACHVNGTEKAFPDPNKAVALTFEAGAAPWNNLADDLLIGPNTASCMSCHQSGAAADQFFLRKHAYDNSWWPSVFENGRQTLLDAKP